MTEKRFTVVVYDDKAINGFAVLDLQKPNNTLRLKYESVYIGSKEGCEIVCGFGNSLAEENKELQVQCNLLREQSNEFHRGARENANGVGQLEKENKELKEENEQLKHDATVLIYSNQEYRKKNEQLKKENYELHKRLGDFEPFERYMKKRTSKTSLEDIIGIVKTDEPTNSVELKKELYK